ncbi:hypothetical protein EE612_015691 [Oryza sativa]|nr:hypothetical protein EE612_015691 [Oryza sativa]
MAAAQQQQQKEGGERRTREEVPAVGRVAIIGGGISGLAAAKQLAAHDPVVFEATPHIGGVWKHCAYRSTRLQTPRPDYEFSDMAWPNRDDPSFPTHVEIVDYLEDYADRFGLWRYIALRSKVVGVKFLGGPSAGFTELWSGSGEPLQGKPMWELAVSSTDDPDSDDVQLYKFEFVVMCTGKYGDVARMPVFPPGKGPEVFKGKVMHSLDYCKLNEQETVELMRGKKVVVVGYKKSAIDLALECAEANQGRAAVHDAGEDPALGGAILLNLGLALLPLLLHSLLPALLREAQPGHLQITPLPPHDPIAEGWGVQVHRVVPVMEASTEQVRVEAGSPVRGGLRELPDGHPARRLLRHGRPRPDPLPALRRRLVLLRERRRPRRRHPRRRRPRLPRHRLRGQGQAPLRPPRALPRPRRQQILHDAPLPGDDTSADTEHGVRGVRGERVEPAHVGAEVQVAGGAAGGEVRAAGGGGDGEARRRRDGGDAADDAVLPPPLHLHLQHPRQRRHVRRPRLPRPPQVQLPRRALRPLQQPGLQGRVANPGRPSFPYTESRYR